MRKLKLITLAIALSGASMTAMAKPADVSAAVAATASRSEDNVKLDESRKPAEVLKFLGLQKGAQAIDLFGGNRYWAEIMAPAVGPKGHVTVWEPTQFYDKEGAEKFAAFQEGIRKLCPGIIVQFSTGGRSGVGSERGGMLHLRPDMASLTTGSCNFPLRIYENTPELITELAGKMREFHVKPEIEVFDLSMLYNAIDFARAGTVGCPLHVQFVLGVKNALPVDRDILNFQVAKLHQLMPDATWVAAGIGKHQIEINRWALEMGGHCRTGLEDNVRWDKTRLAASNAELVKRLADLCGEYDRPVATPTEARQILGLRSAA